jgi:DNA polymerase I-like protein with 3'-5' exonuclease and polymerase domains
MWKAPRIADLPSWQDAKRVCVDVECRDDDLYELGPGVRRGGYVCGIAFAIEDGPAHYLPMRHEGGGNLPVDAVLNYVRDQAAGFTGEVVFNSAPYDLDYLWEDGIEFKRAKAHRDVQVAEPILDELQRTYNLDAICARRGLPGKDESALREHAKAWGIHPKSGLWRLHADAVGPYGIGDVRAPLPLLRMQEKEIDEQGLRETYDLESSVTCPLIRMTRRGLRVDLDELDRVEAWAKERLADYIGQIHHLTGVRIGSLSNAEEVARALRARNIDVPTRIRKGTGAGTNKPAKVEATIQKLWLQQQTDDVAKAVISGREFVKLLGTYVAGYRKHLVGDRIHPSYKQMRSSSDDDGDEGGDEEGGSGARFGRVSAQHPNVQGSMKRSKEILKRWRKVLIADQGADWWYQADACQQEPRITVHYAELCGLPGAARAGDAFRDDPCFDPYQLMVELCKTPKDTDLKKLRDDLKEVYLGRCYGMGGGKLAKKLKLPTEMKLGNYGMYEAAGPEAQDIIDRFDRGVPYVKALARLCTKAAKGKKYILGFDGRRVRFELDEAGEIMEEHKAISKLVQYAAACHTKRALVQLDAEGFPLQLTVHDEFDYSGSSDDQARRMGEIMCDAIKIRVPLRSDVSRGTSYGALEKIFTVTSKNFDMKEAA